MSGSCSSVPLWLDVDPGHDDAFAMILASRLKEFDLTCITTVHGNQSVRKTTSNAADVHYAAGLPKDVPIFRGASEPLCRPEWACPEIHGESGMDGSTVPIVNNVVRETECADSHALVEVRNAVVRAAARNGGRKGVIVATGPLTNVALFLSLFGNGGAAALFDRIVVMGGSIGVGNVMPLSEFNFAADPEAAKRVLECGINVAMVPLNVTHTALADEAVLGRISALGSPFSRWLVDLLTFFEKTYKEVFGFAHPPLHDPCAVLLAARPELFGSRKLRVDIETAGAHTAGAAVCDIYGTTGKEPNVTVAETMQVPEFWNVMIDAITSANAESPVNTT